MSISSRTSLLRHIADESRNFQNLLKCRIPTESVVSSRGDGLTPRSPTLSIPDLTFPSISSVIETLVDAGASPQQASAVSETFQKHASNLRVQTIQRMQRMISELSCSQTQPLSSTFYDRVFKTQIFIFQQQMEKWITDTVSVIQRLTKSVSSSVPPQKRPVFNHEYVPLLDYFFQRDPFPSHADKTSLARKTNMSYRQIHVWFQNRRNRLRKEGKRLPNKLDFEGSSLQYDELKKRMGDRVIPVEQLPSIGSTELQDDYSYDSSEDEYAYESRSLSSEQSKHDILDVQAPQHAFPTPYPPLCDYDPFPTRDGKFHFAPPQWKRLPVKDRANVAPIIDMSNLIRMFADLAVKDDYMQYNKRPRQYSRRIEVRTLIHEAEYSAAILSIATKPPPAPLVSFVFSVENIAVPSPITRLPVVAAPRSHLHAFESPSPQSKPVTLLSAAQGRKAPQSATRRKIAPLPKRIPKGTSISHRHVTPAMSEASILHSASLMSPRASSSGSSETRLFSETSSSSSSPRIRTPASASTSLPRIVTPTLSMPGFSPYQQPSSMSDLFADSPVGTPSQAEGLQLDTNFFGDTHIAKASGFDFFGIPPSTNLVHAQS